ncbi:MAG TPA: 5-(carboxyamino)imidazole ribonucleotide synthase [Cytophagaceae bacterium]|jgi:5-(carboxyamino)imidazole ribonucleotide synthase
MQFYRDFKFGILGGGQLGRMLIQAGIDYNLNPSVLDPDHHAPCAFMTKDFVVGDLTDFDTVYNFGKGKHLLTIEIENVNVEALQKLEGEGVKVFPQPKIVAIIQNKRLQKQFYKDNNIPTSDFILIDNKEELKKHATFFPAFQKLGRAGYDGRGVQKLESIEDLHLAFDEESLIEKKVDFAKELSVIVARNANGQVITYPVVEMVFHPEHNLVEYLFAPADISEATANEAKVLAEKIISSLGMVGLLAVEMFLTKDGHILINEVAPRPHNSGHQTIKDNFTSQYEQHLRAVLNLPLGSTLQKMPSALVNLLGEAGHKGPAVYEGMDEILKMEGVYLHLYGKKVTKPFRKMGHITILEENLERLKAKALKVKETLKVISKA